jgi:hypothetical protein
MDRGRVGEDRGSKETDGCPLTGKLQFVQDYRTLNTIMCKNHYPLPLINDLIQVHATSPSLTCTGDIIMFVSMRVMSGRQPSAQIEASLSHL